MCGFFFTLDVFISAEILLRKKTYSLIKSAFLSLKTV